MLNPSFTKQFNKDLKKVIKQGKDAQKLIDITTKLINEEKLEEKHKDHKLKGDFKERRECHIEPDWLLVYKTEETEIIFERTGSHSELFK